ncbi:hypothetical protein [Polycladidibacter hongkongensis]|uniref:hypothetical protein n=1 Tax=Polycladidibacter hongkongensis TaxID=1647556 RepID=UPI000832315A|nr:hypothetical protein [Pseudovibrio hongkongensis]
MGNYLGLNDTEIVWNALFEYREHILPEGEQQNDERWDDVTYAMACISEGLGLPVDPRVRDDMESELITLKQQLKAQMTELNQWLNNDVFTDAPEKGESIDLLWNAVEGLEKAIEKICGERGGADCADEQ